MVLQRPCLKCGALIASGSYCGRCRPPSSVERLRGRRWMRRRASVLREANYICQNCGMRVAEQVHHIDGDVRNNAMENLMAVDRDCHRQLEAAKRD